MKDYSVYKSKPWQKFLCVTVSGLLCAFIFYVFYHSVWVSLISILLGLLFIKPMEKAIVKHNQQKLTLQFKDLLYSLSSSLSAGQSIEIAFQTAVDDLKQIYPDPKDFINKEVELINYKLSYNVPIEDAIADFAERSHIEDIENFSDIFITCKKTGANLSEIVCSSVGIINEKIDIQQEINASISGKRVEAMLAIIMPVFVLITMSITSNYMEKLYTSLEGRVAMTIVLALLSLAAFLVRKIMEVDV